MIDFDAMMVPAKEAYLLRDKLWGMFPELPSNEEPDFKRFIGGFCTRGAYRKKFGYILLTKEFKYELKTAFRAHGIETFRELGAGTGSLATVLNSCGLQGHGYTLEIPQDDSHWSMTKTEIYDASVSKGFIKIADLNQIQETTLYDMAVSTWVPLGGGQEHITFLEKGSYLPQWYLTINEEGGCTGSHEYHQWVHEHYETVHVFQSYKPFAMLWDTAVLRRLKNTKKILKNTKGIIMQDLAIPNETTSANFLELEPGDKIKITSEMGTFSIEVLEIVSSLLRYRYLKGGQEDAIELIELSAADIEYLDKNTPVVHDFGPNPEEKTLEQQQDEFFMLYEEYRVSKAGEGMHIFEKMQDLASEIGLKDALIQAKKDKLEALGLTVSDGASMPTEKSDEPNDETLEKFKIIAEQYNSLPTGPEHSHKAVEYYNLLNSITRDRPKLAPVLAELVQIRHNKRQAESKPSESPDELFKRYFKEFIDLDHLDTNKIEESNTLVTKLTELADTEAKKGALDEIIDRKNKEIAYEYKVSHSPVTKKDTLYPGQEVIFEKKVAAVKEFDKDNPIILGLSTDTNTSQYFAVEEYTELLQKEAFLIRRTPVFRKSFTAVDLFKDVDEFMEFIEFKKGREIIYAKTDGSFTRGVIASDVSDPYLRLKTSAGDVKYTIQYTMQKIKEDLERGAIAKVTGSIPCAFPGLENKVILMEEIPSDEITVPFRLVSFMYQNRTISGLVQEQTEQEQEDAKISIKLDADYTLTISVKKAKKMAQAGTMKRNSTTSEFFK